MEKMLNLRQAADVLGIQLRTVREWVRSGRLVGVKMAGSNRWSVPESEIVRVQNGENKMKTPDLGSG